MPCVVGSINQDLVSFVARIPGAGETLTGKEFRMFPGGKGANQAVAVARLGQPVRIIAAVGRDILGEGLVRNLRQNGVDTGAISCLDGISSGTALIFVEDSGENRIVVNPGANGCLTPAHVESFAGDLATSKVTLLQLEVPLETVECAAQKAHQAGSLVVLDPAPIRPLSSDLLQNVDLLTPNQTELARLAGVENPASVEACAEAARLLIEQGVQSVAVKMGGHGCLVVEQHRVIHLAAYPVEEVVDTTGAGDAFNGGLAVALLEGQPMLDACRFASAVAALSLTQAGAQSALPTRLEVQAFMASRAEPSACRLR